MQIQTYRLHSYKYGCPCVIVNSSVFHSPKWSSLGTKFCGNRVRGSWSPGRYSRTKLQALREAVARRRQVPHS